MEALHQIGQNSGPGEDQIEEILQDKDKEERKQVALEFSCDFFKGIVFLDRLSFQGLGIDKTGDHHKTGDGDAVPEREKIAQAKGTVPFCMFDDDDEDTDAFDDIDVTVMFLHYFYFPTFF